jgi:hypothetical protein
MCDEIDAVEGDADGTSRLRQRIRARRCLPMLHCSASPRGGRVDGHGSGGADPRRGVGETEAFDGHPAVT